MKLHLDSNGGVVIFAVKVPYFEALGILKPKKGRTMGDVAVD